MSPSERKVDLIHEIGGLIVGDKRYRDIPWDAIALTVTIDGTVIQMSGFAYLDDGKIVPQVPRMPGLSDRFEELRDAMAATEPRGWVAALVQIRRATMGINFDFEYDDISRWKITPFNLEARREELRPK